MMLYIFYSIVKGVPGQKLALKYLSAPLTTFLFMYDKAFTCI